MAAWNKWLNSLSDDVIDAPATLADVRSQVVAALQDCKGQKCERLRWQLESAGTAHDLWLLRGEIFQLVASQHCQAEAQSRINALLPVFEGWIPARLLTAIQ